LIHSSTLLLRFAPPIGIAESRWAPRCSAAQRALLVGFGGGNGRG
jgi:hypothetical protein